MSEDLRALTERLRAFGEARDWRQFHSPKNLVMALIGEAGELVEHFQWLTEAESRNLEPTTLAKVREEMADVQAYLLLLADQLNVDLLAAVADKIAVNESKYPVELARGRKTKYTDL